MTECNQEVFGFTALFRAACKPGSRLAKCPAMVGRSCCARWIARSTCCGGWQAVLAMATRPCWSSTSCRRCFRSASTGWPWATKTSTITSSCSPIPCSVCWPASANWTVPLRARARSTGSNSRAAAHAITRSATRQRRSTSCWWTSTSSRTPSRQREIVLDLDATDIPLHGDQPERFFHRGPHGQVFVRGVARLLRPLLLSAAVHLLWRSTAVCAAAAVEPGCQRCSR